MLHPKWWFRAAYPLYAVLLLLVLMIEFTPLGYVAGGARNGPRRRAWGCPVGPPRKGSSGPGLRRIEQNSGMITPVTASSTWGPMFPGGSPIGATYKGRIVDANDDGALWLVEEMPSGRGIVVSEPVQGDATLLLEHVNGATGFFATSDAMYWQEGDELLTAPRAGGAASIVATLPGPAGAIADGYAYFVDGNAIKRLPVD